VLDERAHDVHHVAGHTLGVRVGRVPSLDALPADVREVAVPRRAGVLQPLLGRDVRRRPPRGEVRPADVGIPGALDQELDEVPRVQQHRLEARLGDVVLCCVNHTDGV
jgi:hypothetical protein